MKEEEAGGGTDDSILTCLLAPVIHMTLDLDPVAAYKLRHKKYNVYASIQTYINIRSIFKFHYYSYQATGSSCFHVLLTKYDFNTYYSDILCQFHYVQIQATQDACETNSVQSVLSKH